MFTHIPLGRAPEFGGDPADTQTDAKECIVVWNRDGEVHLVLFFDLKPDVQLQVSADEVKADSNRRRS